MYTSLLLAVVLGPGAAPHAVAPEALTWQKDYVAARKKGRQENRPLAVFIGRGPQGWEQVCLESKMTPAVRTLLEDSYVCVYVDTAEARGKRLADEFDLARGVVLSTRDGESQAFRQDGRISCKDLKFTLEKFANGYRNSRTETLQEIQQVSYRAPARPAAPAPIMQSFGGFSGGFGGFRGGSC
jgi:hypothetical protein